MDPLKNFDEIIEVRDEEDLDKKDLDKLETEEIKDKTEEVE